MKKVKSISKHIKVIMVTAGFLLVSAGNAHANLKYECWTYVNGKPDKMTHVVAANKGQAETLAVAKFRDIGVPRFDSVSCK
ncbi:MULTISPECIES: hypothetical protein [Nitrincola]|uniref:Uncharacterized protein n=1 Tax=Nitrincola nitratireducens TaxID=1229521 RepID=W9UWF3_9GAMM|nr:MULTISPECIES: hypothetical protein [Nitrincola]EXJ09061.1 hypothetical protein D791_04008 [Nitrincola nitratireducens]